MGAIRRQRSSARAWRGAGRSAGRMPVSGDRGRPRESAVARCRGRKVGWWEGPLDVRGNLIQHRAPAATRLRVGNKCGISIAARTRAHVVSDMPIRGDSAREDDGATVAGLVDEPVRVS